MKELILAGGLGTRISEEIIVRPKPMIEIGGMAALWQFLKIYSHQGVNDFMFCLGRTGFMVKAYFVSDFLNMPQYVTLRAISACGFARKDQMSGLR